MSALARGLASAGKATRGARGTELQLSTLESSIGLISALTGAILLVAPNQFDHRVLPVLGPVLPLWGLVLLLAGVALISLRPMLAQPRITTAVHIVTGTALVALAIELARASAWTGASMFLALGAGTLGTSFVRTSRSAPRRANDPLAVTLAGGALMAGAALTIAPEGWRVSPYSFANDNTRLIGVCFLVAGVALAYAHLNRSLGRRTNWVAHGFTATVFIAFLALGPLPYGVWTGMAVFGGFGAMLALLPWLGPRIATIDAASLRTRLGLALVAAAGLPLVAAFSVLYGGREPKAAAHPFETLLIVSIVAGVAGVLAAGWLARSFRALAAAADQLAAGEEFGPLPRSSVTEVRHVTFAFETLRDRLAQRTAEREKAEAGLRRPTRTWSS
jgi:hypothetical protein